MAVDLSSLRIASAEPAPMDFGITLTPALGGPIQRVDRLGSRWQWRFATPPVRIEPEGAAWAALLMRAWKEGALIPVAEPDRQAVPAGSPVVASLTSAGTLVPISGLPAGYVILPGRWVSIIVGGRRYLDLVAEGATANGAGAATIRLTNLIRVALPAGATVELAEPKIEGQLTAAPSWPLMGNRLTQFEFTVQEMA